MATFMVDSESISVAAGRVGASSAAIRTEVSALMSELLALNSTWSGAASTQFAECVSQWRNVQAQVELALESIGAQLNTASAVYADAEAQSAALFAS